MAFIKNVLGYYPGKNKLTSHEISLEQREIHKDCMTDIIPQLYTFAFWPFFTLYLCMGQKFQV